MTIAILALLLWCVFYFTAGLLLRMKLKLLDDETFSTETKSINMQNLVLLFSVTLLFVSMANVAFLNDGNAEEITVSNSVLYCIS